MLVISASIAIITMHQRCRVELKLLVGLGLSKVFPGALKAEPASMYWHQKRNHLVSAHPYIPAHHAGADAGPSTENPIKITGSCVYAIPRAADIIPI